MTEEVRQGGAAFQGLPKSMRLAKRWQFVAVTGRQNKPDMKLSGPCFLLLGRASGLNFNRLGVTVSKKTAPRAVDRNRIKRIVREFFRLNTSHWPSGYDLVFIARPEAARAARRDLWSALIRLGQKLAKGGARPPSGGAASSAGHPATPAAAGDRGAPPARFGPAAAAFDFFEWLLKGLALGLIYTYQRLISPLLPPSCRFRPTCSRYAVQAISLHGFWRGSYLTARRLLKCHPFHPGGYDPVPPVKDGP